MKNQYHLGILLVILSAVVFSTVGIFTKGVQTAAWGVIFWRGISAAAFTFTYTIAAGTFRHELARFGWPAVLATCLGASGTAAFISAFKYTSIANVALIWATAPFVTAFMTWIILSERPRPKIMIASCVSMIGVAIVVSDSFGDGGSLRGDLMAFWMTLMVSGMMVVYRVWPSTPAALPAAMSSVVLLPFAFLFINPFTVPEWDLWILIAFGLIFAIASVTLAEGVIRVPVSEAALLSTIEMPLAPFWALLILSEVPKVSSVIGGVIILVAVLWSQWPSKQKQA